MVITARSVHTCMPPQNPVLSVHGLCTLFTPLPGEASKRVNLWRSQLHEVGQIAVQTCRFAHKSAFHAGHRIDQPHAKVTPRSEDRIII